MTIRGRFRRRSKAAPLESPDFDPTNLVGGVVRMPVANLDPDDLARLICDEGRLQSSLIHDGRSWNVELEFVAVENGADGRVVVLEVAGLGWPEEVAP